MRKKSYYGTIFTKGQMLIVYFYAAKKPKTVRLGKRTFTAEEMEELSAGTHSLMKGLPEIDPDVDPFNVEGLKAMHPWLKVHCTYTNTHITHCVIN